jgi:carbamate kinase
MRKTIVVALGGNAITQASEKGTVEEQFANVYKTCEQLVKLLAAGYRLVITHGNGPQAGALLIQQESAVSEIPAQPLDVVTGMTQGQVGYMFMQAMNNLLYEARMQIPVVSIINQVLVSEDDPDYQDPSKPVGPFYTKAEAETLMKEKSDWIMKQVKPDSVERNWRRVVASPEPLQNVEYIAVRKMVDSGIVVVASGGGGVSVIYDKETGRLKGTAAVIDKDLAGEKLAEVVGADIFLILTDVKNAKINFGKENEAPVEIVSLTKIKELHDEGHFLAGSMGPKVMAAMKFVKYGGDRSIITSLDNAFNAVSNKSGTQILPDRFLQLIKN